MMEIVVSKNMEQWVYRDRNCVSKAIVGFSVNRSYVVFMVMLKLMLKTSTVF